MLPPDSRLFGASFNHPAVAEAFSDERFIQQMLLVEAELARAMAELEIIPAEAGERIAELAPNLKLDIDRLREGIEQAGFPVIELVRQLRQQLDDASRPWVHWGTTTQDIMDTARILQIAEVLPVMEADLAAVISKLAEMAQAHRDQLMAGRTHNQQAVPITFGYKVATWLSPLIRQRARLDELKPRLLVLQFGGAAGTLAVYGQRGPELYQALGRRLKLRPPVAPWHAQRDRLVEFANWLSLTTGSLAKLAGDVVLLSQTEVGELSETAEQERGGSSSMPHKHNPIASEVILAAAQSNAAALSAMHRALVQEHERGTHGSQLEWLTLPQMIALTAAALHKAVSLGERLVVNQDRMSENLQASQGVVLAEAVRTALSSKLAAAEAEALVREASRAAQIEKRHLLEIVRERTDLQLDWERLSDESAHLGACQWFIDRVLESV